MAENDVSVSTIIGARPERVWHCITDPSAVAQWMMGAQMEADWEPGGEISWSGEFDGTPYRDTGKVMEIDPERRLVHTHTSSMSESEAPHVVSWLLEPDGDDRTELTLVQHGATSAEQAEQFRRNWVSMLDGLRAAAEA